MIEIIPNWHPIFVHFTVGLFSAAVGFYWLSFIVARISYCKPALSQEFEAAARWCLWIAALVTIGTVSAGLYAYYTVGHDEISHVAMTNHRNWAIPTAVAIILMALWSVALYVKQKKLNLIFLLSLLIVQGMLLATAWRGAELVYRYGLGVMSLPQTEEVGHNHQHHEG
jgi:uncharacterized membrane protein